MYREEFDHHSRVLDKDMHIVIYGNGGMPLLGFPTQNSMAGNYEDFGMIHQLTDYLEGGRIQLFTVDSVDAESWSLSEGDKEWRAARQEQYFHYIIEEVIPFMRERNDQAPAVTGFSMGANHALITFLRRPDLFRGVMAFSGVYDSDFFFDGWMNAVLYDSSPERFLPQMSADHPYIGLYNERRMILCCGQGAWEEDSLRTLRYLEEVFREKGIHAWCDYWGYDVNHDWPWWYKQIRYFLPFMLGDQ